MQHILCVVFYAFNYMHHILRIVFSAYLEQTVWDSLWTDQHPDGQIVTYRAAITAKNPSEQICRYFEAKLRWNQTCY